MPKNIEFAYKLKNLTFIFLQFHSLVDIKLSILDVLQGSEYTPVFVLALLVYCCKFMCRSDSIHLQTLQESILGQLYLAASLNMWDPAYSTLSLSLSLFLWGLVVVGGLTVGVLGEICLSP